MLLPALDKVIPIDFDNDPALADWANLLGSIREPDFQICLNFVEGRQVNLMLSMSRIMTRIGRTGFSSTERVVDGLLVGPTPPPGWRPGCPLSRCADSPSRSRCSIRFAQTIEMVRAAMAPQGGATDWPEEHERTERYPPRHPPATTHVTDRDRCRGMCRCRADQLSDHQTRQCSRPLSSRCRQACT